MVEILVEVSDAAGKTRLTVREKSIERALRVAKGRAGKEARVLFPIDPETFFAGRRPEERVRA